MKSAAAVGKAMRTEWYNYETWAVAQWLGIDEWSAAEVDDVLRSVATETDGSCHKLKWRLADWLRNRLEAGMPDVEVDVYQRLLLGAVEHVDWDELADRIVEHDAARKVAPGRAA
jgi:hypothetical protein